MTTLILFCIFSASIFSIKFKDKTALIDLSFKARILSKAVYLFIFSNDPSTISSKRRAFQLTIRLLKESFKRDCLTLSNVD